MDNKEPSQSLTAYQSEIELLSELVSDKEDLIDNLMSRAAELEKFLVDHEGVVKNLQHESSEQDSHIKSLNKAIQDRDELIASLQAEAAKHIELAAIHQQQENVITNLEGDLKQQQQHIKSLNRAIKQRDGHVAKLEEKANQTLDLLSQQEQRIEQYNDLSNAVLENQSKIDHCLESINSKVTGKEFLKATKRLDSIGDTLKSLPSTFEEISSKTLEAHDLDQTLALSNTIADLTHAVDQRDQWGANIQRRLHQVDAELSNIKVSRSWKLARLLALPSKLFSKIVSILKSPYSIIVGLGWKYAPTLFHRIYHQPLVAKLYQNKPINQLETTVSAHIERPSNTPQPNPQTETEPAASGAYWSTGSRIDGRGN